MRLALVHVIMECLMAHYLVIESHLNQIKCKPIILSKPSVTGAFY